MTTGADARRENGVRWDGRGEPEPYGREGLNALRRLVERQGNGGVRPLGEVVRLGQEVVVDARQRRVGLPEGGGEEVAKRGGDLGGDDEGIIGVGGRRTPRPARCVARILSLSCETSRMRRKSASSRL